MMSCCRAPVLRAIVASVSLGVVLAGGRELQASLAPRDPCPAPGSAVALDWDPAEAPIVPA